MKIYFCLFISVSTFRFNSCLQSFSYESMRILCDKYNRAIDSVLQLVSTVYYSLTLNRLHRKIRTFKLHFTGNVLMGHRMNKADQICVLLRLTTVNERYFAKMITILKYGFVERLLHERTAEHILFDKSIGENPKSFHLMWRR